MPLEGGLQGWDEGTQRWVTTGSCTPGRRGHGRAAVTWPSSSMGTARGTVTMGVPAPRLCAARRAARRASHPAGLTRVCSHARHARGLCGITVAEATRCHTHSAGRQLCSGDGIAHIAVTFHVAAVDVRVIGSMRAGDAEGGSEPTPPGGGTMTATHPHHPHKDWESGSATPSLQHHPCRRAEGGPRLHVAPPAPTPAAGRGGGGGDGGDVSALFPPGDSKQPFSKGHRMAPAVGHRGRGTGRGAPPAPCIGKAQGWQTGHCPPPLFMALHFPPETH